MTTSTVISIKTRVRGRIKLKHYSNRESLELINEKVLASYDYNPAKDSTNKKIGRKLYYIREDLKGLEQTLRSLEEITEIEEKVTEELEIYGWLKSA